MASAFTHAAVGAAIGTVFYRKGDGAPFWILGCLCAALPDVDAIGFFAGIPYTSAFGHRGFTHSLLFAALVAAGLSWWLFKKDRRIGFYLFAATASHGVLDAMTNGGLGVGFFIPFSDSRYFLPWRPIAVSPIGISKFFHGRGLAVMVSELRWVWLPSALFAIAVSGGRKMISRSAP